MKVDEIHSRSLRDVVNVFHHVKQPLKETTDQNYFNDDEVKHLNTSFLLNLLSTIFILHYINVVSCVC